MTLWDIAAAIIKDRWQNRRRRQPWMAEWPYWTKPSRLNIIERYLIRRGLVVVVLLLLFKINPFHPLSIAVTLLGLSLVMTEHRTHERQRRLLYNIKRRKVLR